MVWHETDKPGVWHDKLDGAEGVFYGMSKAFAGLAKEHGSVYACCQFKVVQQHPYVSLEALLRDSWKALRFDFPALSVFVEGSKKVYEAATTQSVEKWAQETFWVDSLQTASDILPTLHVRRLPCLIFLPHLSEVVFHSSHWRIDALGACMVLDRLFDILASQISSPCCPTHWHLEAQNLSWSLEDAAGCSPTGSNELARALADAIRQRNFVTSYPSAGLPYKGDAATPPATHRTRAKLFTADATSQLVAACRRKSISVTAAVHAACANVIFDMSKHDQYSTIVSVNLRDYLRMPYGTPTRACATYVTGIMHTLQRVDDFSAKSTALTNAYRGSNWEPKEYVAALRPIIKLHSETLREIATSTEKREPASNVTISSLGIIEKHLKKDHGASVVTVEQFRLGSAIMTRQSTLYIWTFQGELCLSVDYNEAYYDDIAVSTLLEGLIECLERELMINLTAKE